MEAPSSVSVLSRAIDAVGDGLWGAEDQRAHPAPHTRPVFLGVAVAIVVLLVLRRIDAVTNPQFWAEDGSVFFQQNFKLGCWRALHTHFRGFPYLGQRLVACAATASPLARCARLQRRGLRRRRGEPRELQHTQLPARDPERRAASRLLPCGPRIATGVELVGSLTNTSWFLGIWLLLLTIMRLPRSSVALAILGLAGLVATFSAPLSILTAPLWFVRALHAVRGRRSREVAFATWHSAACSSWSPSAVTSGAIRSAPRVSRDPCSTASRSSCSPSRAGPACGPGFEAHLGRSGMYAIAVALLAALAALAWRSRRRSLPILLFLRLRNRSLSSACRSRTSRARRDGHRRAQAHRILVLVPRAVPRPRGDPGLPRSLRQHRSARASRRSRSIASAAGPRLARFHRSANVRGAALRRSRLAGARCGPPAEARRWQPRSPVHPRQSRSHRGILPHHRR